MQCIQLFILFIWLLTCSTLLERQRDSPCGLCASAITVFIPVNKKSCTKRENKEQLIKAPRRQIRRRTFAAELFRSVEWWSRAVEPQGCRCCRSPAGKSHLTSRRRWDPLGRARPEVLTTPIARQRRTLIRLSCCMRRTVPVVGQGEVTECLDAHLLMGASVTRRIQIVFAFIVVMRPRK